MDLRLCLCLFIIGSSWCCAARDLAVQNPLITETEDVLVLQTNNLEEPRQVQSLEEVNGNEQLCTLCEEYTAKALDYMANNKTQTQIIDLLHKSCSKMRFYKKEVLYGKSCDLCHQVVTEVKSKLKDPDTQLEILELLLKACGAIKPYAKKCKNLVFEFAPVILVNAEQFLEQNDVCAILHACEPAVDKDLPSPRKQTSLHSVS